MIRRWMLPLLGTLACTAAETPAAPDEPLRGGEFQVPIPKPSFSLTDQHGQPFDFRAETNGYVTLLFFGYTYCPDICPLHMSRIGQALREVEPAIAERVKVVFVSADPERDTPARLQEWLSAFHPDFIGLRGTTDEIAAIVTGLRFTAPRIEPVNDDFYGVAHPSGVLAFTPDNLGRFIYLGGLGGSKEDFVHDLPLLATRNFGS